MSERILKIVELRIFLGEKYPQVRTSSSDALINNNCNLIFYVQLNLLNILPFIQSPTFRYR